MKKQSGFTTVTSQRGGILSTLFFLFMVLVALAVVSWAFFLPNIVASVVGSRTGFALSAAQLTVNPFNGKLNIQELRITNPTSFPNGDFVALRRLEAHVDLASLFSDRVIVHDAAFDLESLTLVRTEDGRLNATLFGELLSGPATPETTPAATPTDPPAETSKPKAFLIKKLDVKVGKVRVENYADGKRSAREVVLNLSQSYSNVTDVKQLLTGPMLENLGALGSALGNLLPSEWSQVWSRGVESGRKLFKDLGKKTSEALRSAAETLEEKSKP